MNELLKTNSLYSEVKQENQDNLLINDGSADNIPVQFEIVKYEAVC
jgi:hypothetical protein